MTYRGKPLREPLSILWDKRRPLPRYARTFCEMWTETYVAEPSPAGAILRPMKVEEIAEVVAKLPPDQLADSAAGSPHSRRAAPTTPRSSTPLRPNLVASPATRLLN